jgi:hypothetical protein
LWPQSGRDQLTAQLIKRSKKAMSNISKHSGLALLLLDIVLMNDAAAGGHQFVQRFGDSAIQRFNSRMNDSAIQRFDSHMRNSTVQRFESRMLKSPVQGFNSQMLNSAIQRFNSQMMNSPAQRPWGPWNGLRFFQLGFYPMYVPMRLLVPATVEEIETPPEEHVSRSTRPPQFISLRCGIFTEMTVGDSEVLSEKEEVPCDHSEEDRPVIPNEELEK